MKVQYNSTELRELKGIIDDVNSLGDNRYNVAVTGGHLAVSALDDDGLPAQDIGRIVYANDMDGFVFEPATGGAK